MRRTDLVEKVAATSGISKSDAQKAVETIFAGISSALGEGADVRIAGFGTFTVKKRAARQGRNPRTGEPIQIPEGKTVSFRPGKDLNAVAKARS